ncbi:MAG: glutaredoxin domain-containing protein [bacterium]
MSDTPKVIVYSATWCAFCHAAKDYMDSINVKYEDKDVDSDKAIAQESVDKSGQMGIPVIDVAGEIIIGFNRPKLDELLKKHKLIK